MEESVCESRRQSPLKQIDSKAEGLTKSTENMLDQVKAEIELSEQVEAPQAAASATEETSGEKAKLADKS